MKEDYIARGFQKIHDDLAFLMTCFQGFETRENIWLQNLPGLIRSELTWRPIRDFAKPIPLPSSS